MNFIIIPGAIENLTSRKDRSWKITVGTQELTPEQVQQLTKLIQEFCYIAFKHEPFTTKEEGIIKTLQSELDFTGKSPAQRLRAILYLNWKHDTEGFKDANMHYVHHMEKIINHYKNKLD